MEKLNKDALSIQTLRVLSVEQSTKAKSGHPGIALGAAPIIHTLYTKIINTDPRNDAWFNRDRFILAAGHGSSLLYSVLHVAGFGLTVSDLENFRQYESLTPGHPELGLTKGVDATSGPLGQGIAEAVGMAIAEEFLGAKFNKENLPLVNHYTYVLCGDGDLQEGVTQEAISIAGHLGLKKLIVLYDSNDIQLDGKLNLANSEKIMEKYTAAGWNYIFVEDGEKVDDIEKAISIAKLSDKPTMIEIKTIIGFGSEVANSSKAHGSPLSEAEVKKFRSLLGGKSFETSEEVFKYYQETLGKRGALEFSNWEKLNEEYKLNYPDEFIVFNKMIHDQIDIDFHKLIEFDKSYNKATRVSSGEIINAISKINPGFIGGSADLSSSTKAKGADGDFSKTNRLGRNINFGVREHAMAAITNGIMLHKGLKAFCSGFFVFSDYMKPAMRLSSLMELPVTYVFTHDSIAVGEDGPTHEPIEQLTMLRSIPNFNTIRPADANETKVAWDIAYHSKRTPTALVLTRQDVEMVTNTELAKNVKKGGYIISYEKNRIDGIIMASGSELCLALNVKEKLAKDGYDIRVVSMPCLNIFDKQPDEYKNEVLPSFVKVRMAIEMGDATHFYKYLGLNGKLINIQKFGMSAPAQTLIVKYGFTIDNIVKEFINALSNK